ncbi:MAG: hypothetical protein HKN77_06865 [Woeseiaceae bacterium]|nr:hypothetical protein [Woeseiaceae bacterium]
MNSPVFYWFVTGFLIVWGLAYTGLVVFSFLLSTEDHWAELVAQGRITAEYAAYISEIPGWAVFLTMVIALTRLLGGIALAFQSSWAVPIYAISLCIVCVIMFRAFVLADVASVIHTSQVFLEAGVMALSIFSVWFSYRQHHLGILI